jgi:protein-disulfide isomerase
MPLLEQVLKEYPEKVKLVYKCFPLDNHPYAEQAAVAAIAAGMQGKFWEFHDAIYQQPSQLTEKSLNSIARNLHLDMNQYQRDKKSKAVKTVTRDKLEGRQMEVRGTPTIFVNEILVKKRTMEVFKYLIDRELKKNQQGG